MRNKNHNIIPVVSQRFTQRHALMHLLSLVAAILCSAPSATSQFIEGPPSGLSGMNLYGLMHACPDFKLDIDGDGLPDGQHYRSEYESFDGYRWIGKPISSGPYFQWGNFMIDLDGDGFSDAMNLFPFVKFGTGPGQFEAEIDVTHGRALTTRSWVTVADIDGNGRLDILHPEVWTSSVPPTAIRVFFQNEPRSFAIDPSKVIGIPKSLTSNRGAVPVDLDSDGDIDILAIGSPFEVGINDGSGNIHSAQAIDPGAGAYMCWLVDFDQDGFIDFVPVGGPLDPIPARIYLNDGTGNFSSTPIPGVQAMHAVTALDYDEDGDPDLFLQTTPALVLPSGVYRTRVFENTGGALFVERTESMVPPSRSVASSALDPSFTPIDVDADGDIDVQIFRYGSANPRPYWFYNTKRHLLAPDLPSIGNPFHLDTYADAGRIAITNVSFAESALRIRGMGFLLVDPASTVSSPPTIMGTSRTSRLTLPIPNDGSLVGVRFTAQSVIVDPNAGTTRFTNALSLVVQD